MTADTFATSNEKALSGALALVMHLMFVALLIFGVSWQKRQPEAMIVDLWNNLPPLAAPKPEPAPEVKPEPEPPKPEPPRVEPKAVVKPVPKPVPKVEPKPDVKADIALREKKEKERKALEQELAEKKKREQEVVEKKRREQEQLAALKRSQAQEAEVKRLAREQEDALKKLAQQQATAQNKLVDEYVAKIQAKIKNRVNKAACASLSSPEIQIRVTLTREGNIMASEPEVRKSSGLPACDAAVVRAVMLADPLPVPSDPELFHRVFRDLNLKLHPNQ